MTLSQFEKKLSKLLSDFEEGDREMVYAEIFEYAKKVTPKFMKISENVQKILHDALKK